MTTNTNTNKTTIATRAIVSFSYARLYDDQSHIIINDSITLINAAYEDCETCSCINECMNCVDFKDKYAVITRVVEYCLSHNAIGLKLPITIKYNKTVKEITMDDVLHFDNSDITTLVVRDFNELTTTEIGNVVTNKLNKKENDTMLNETLDKKTLTEEEAKEQEDNFTEFDKNVLEATVEKNTKKLVNYLSKTKLAELVNSKDSEVYDNLGKELRVLISTLLAKGKAREAAEVMHDAGAIKDTVEKAPVTKVEKIKAFIALVFRKTLALLKGTAFFVFDTTTILGALVVRVAYHTGREVAYAAKEIGKSFMVDVVASVK